MAAKALPILDAAGIPIKRATIADEDFDEDDVRKLMRGNPLLNQPAPEEVQLGMKKIKDDIAKEIAAILDPQTQHVSGSEELAIAACKRLFLYDNSITEDGATALSEMLRHNSVLEELYLHYNSIGDDGAIAFGEALKENKALKRLELGGNGVGEPGAFALIEGLKGNCTLTKLGLFGNDPSIDDDLAEVNQLLREDERKKRQSS